MTSNSEDLYNAFLYPNYLYPQSHPDRLGSLATYFGMQPAPIEHCRVLELGSGDGANLIPAAFNLPDSRFLGIDRASEPIARGLQMIENLNLKNVTLKAADILELEPNIGEFDYIIAHGLFSWVPPAVQERILQICRSCLAPQGVAYISYNAYPGCHLRAIVRGMMLFHTRGIQNQKERVAQARALISWVADSQPSRNGYALIMKEMSEKLATRDSAVVFHDDLAEVNTPYYFHEFVTRAAQHGLKFLSEAEYFITLDNTFSAEVSAQLRSLEDSNILAKEQYQDFLEGRSFRQTLLCHHEVELDRSLRPEIIRKFYIRAETTAVSKEPELETEHIEEFAGPQESKITTSLPLAKAALRYLGSVYPRSARFAELAQEACRILNRPAAVDLDSEEATALAEVLLKAFGAGVVQLNLHEPKFSARPGERPLASPLARLQCEQGPIATSLLYRGVKFEDQLSRHLLSLLDGTRDRTQLFEEIWQLVEKHPEGVPEQPQTTEELQKFVHDRLDERLNFLARVGFLVE